MKNTKMKQSIAALAMAAVVAVSLLGYGCGSKSASTTGAGATGDFTGTAKGFGGDVTVTLTLTDGKITGCTAEGADETEGVGSKAIEQLPAAIAESGSIAVDGVSTATITSNAIKEAAAAAITAAGLKPEDFQTAVENNAEPAEDSTVDTDIVIVGAGGAGMTAALTATSEGKSVVIVESQPVVGGNSVRATGGMNAGKTVYQDENEFAEGAGVEKTLKAAAEKYADNETITALAATVAEQWAAYQANPTGYFDSVELMELDTMIGGKGVNDPALVETLCSNSADAIDWLGEQGITLNSVSSAGGASVKRIHRPVNEEGKVVSVGAYMVPLLEEDCQKAGVQMMLNTTATEILRGDGAVLINSEGKRFIDEVSTRDVVSAAEIAQPGSYSWLIIDQKMVDDSSVIQGYIKKGYTFEGKTYEELAEQIGVDGAALAETMNTWNGYVEAKNDPDFGRTSFADKLDTAPYYAIKVTAGVHHTMGGLKINTNTEVLNENGEVIPGLFAAGEVTGGVHGANRLGGTAVSDFVVFGRIAGAAASKYAA